VQGAAKGQLLWPHGWFHSWLGLIAAHNVMHETHHEQVGLPPASK
jgi:hypothetical protein